MVIELADHHFYVICNILKVQSDFFEFLSVNCVSVCSMIVYQHKDYGDKVAYICNTSHEHYAIEILDILYLLPSQGGGQT